MKLTLSTDLGVLLISILVETMLFISRLAQHGYFGDWGGVVEGSFIFMTVYLIVLISRCIGKIK